MSIAPKTSVISIIIPTLNAASRLGVTLAAIVAVPGVEVVLVDGGSTDETVDIAQSFGMRVLVAEPGRAHQMNVGAAAAGGDIFLFLHGDTVLPFGFADMVREALADQDVVAGAFRLAFDPTDRALRLIACGANLRSRWLQMPYGDQAFFLRKELFTATGGFPEMPILEDLALVRRMKRHGRIVIRPEAIITSPRRWRQRGAFVNTLRNQLILLGFFLGLSLERLAKWYRLGKDV